MAIYWYRHEILINSNNIFNPIEYENFLNLLLMMLLLKEVGSLGEQ